MNNHRIYIFGEFKLVTKERVLYKASGSAEEIGGMVYDLLVHLLDHPNEALENSELLKGEWIQRNRSPISDESYRQLIKRLRFLLDDKDRLNQRYIQRTPNITKFIKDVEVIGEVAHANRTRITIEPPCYQTPIWRSSIDERALHGFQMGLRAEDARAVRESLTQCPILSIVGEPQIGKTSLAHYVARQFSAEGRPVFSHDFRLDRPSMMIERFLARAGAPIQSSVDDNVWAFVLTLMNEEWFLLMDNFESALNPSDLSIEDQILVCALQRLAASMSALKSYVLFTSRYLVLTQYGDRAFPDYRLLGVDSNSATHYLSETYGWSEKEAKQIYAIRIGHPHVMHRCSVDLRQKMTGFNLEFEDAIHQLRPEMVTVYAELYKTLNTNERILVNFAALHPLGVHIEGLNWLKEQKWIGVDVLDLVLLLHNKGAISKTDDNQVQLLPLDQSYVYRVCGDWLVSGHVRLAEYYQSCLISKSRDSLDFGDKEAFCERLFYHSVNARCADLAYSSLFDYGWNIHLASQGRHATLSDTCRQIRSCPDFSALPPLRQADVNYREGVSRIETGELLLAKEALEAATKLFEQLSQPVQQANAIAELGMVVRKSGQRGTVEQAHYEQALKLIGSQTTAETKRIRSKILARLAKALERDVGRDATTILSLLGESLSLAKELGDERWIAHRLGQLGAAYRDINRDYFTSIKYLKEAVAIANRIGDYGSITTSLAGLGAALEKDKQFTAAERCYREALDRTAQSDVYGMLDRMGRFAHVSASLRHFDESEHHYKQAIHLAERIDNRKAQAENLDGLGTVLRTKAYEKTEDEKEDLLNRAYECHARALAIQETLEGEAIGRANRYQELGRTVLAIGNYSEALCLFLKSLSVLKSVPLDPRVKHLQAWQFLRIGESLERLGNYNDALVCYTKAADLFGARDKSEQLKANKRIQSIGSKALAQIPTVGGGLDHAERIIATLTLQCQ